MSSFQNRDFGNCFAAFVCLLLAQLAASCLAVSRREALPYAKPPVEKNRIAEILDYQNSGAGLAGWAAAYMDGGITALEKMDEFASCYAFVAEQSSPNLDTLLLWGENFNVEIDFPQLVFLRAYRRLTDNLSINPDETYGSFFETFMKRMAALRWPEARQYASTWLLARYLPSSPDVSELSEPQPPDADETADSNRYIYLILNIIEKADLENGIAPLLDDFDGTLPRDQAQAVNSVRARFFDGF
ncbi:MAG: hypothetical protein LBH50_04340 [Spirochaetaceae bacterium]|nr:hypothetical protein [Spirochaetaceae bacterium]